MIFLELIIFGEAKSTDTVALGSWAHARADRHTSEKTIFGSTLPRLESTKKGV